MYILVGRHSLARLVTKPSVPAWRRLYSASSPASLKPLRILFCGSDSFSARALQRLHREHVGDASFIQSIDVVKKLDKPSGRGMKTFSPSQNTTPPLGYRCVIWPAGTSSDPRSSYISLWGPAPLHHTLLEGRTASGVTLQTLHPKHFDSGDILSSVSFDLPANGWLSYPELRDFAADHGANLLVDSLRRGLYARSQASKNLPTGDTGHKHAGSHARKLTPEDAHVDWATWSAERVLRTVNALGRVWNDVPVIRKNKSVETRVSWTSVAAAENVPEEAIAHATALPPSPPALERDTSPSPARPGP
ncbi:hypothetical protein FH972_025885 [Carpinus fangiana]|uniref:Uncharacterized protein n=1 Tax=Carpinus fangiana TaxID=176857 RepID=A0A5N6L2B2_9ROSI|nr:hypothetical protein FH972_025885 [Carpinus fangiana]